jgi:hypothetical protein
MVARLLWPVLPNLHTLDINITDRTNAIQAASQVSQAYQATGQIRREFYVII